MLVAGGNGSFAQITAPLRVTLSQAGLRITGSDMCDCVYRRILRYITPPSFPCKHYGHILQMLGAFWVERYRKKTGQLKERRNCFSQILQRQQIYLWISSLLLTSPGWMDEVCSEFNTSQLRDNLALNYFIPVKWSRTGRKAPSFI